MQRAERDAKISRPRNNIAAGSAAHSDAGTKKPGFSARLRRKENVRRLKLGDIELLEQLLENLAGFEFHDGALRNNDLGLGLVWITADA